jgi:hypothetical protein
MSAEKRLPASWLSKPRTAGLAAIAFTALASATHFQIEAAPLGGSSVPFVGIVPARSAETTTGRRSASMLYEVCEAETDRPLNWCEGYLLGLADVLLAMGNSRMDGGICNAAYAPATLGRIFKAWLERHPDRSQEDMMVAAQAAFRERWPCK